MRKNTIPFCDGFVTAWSGCQHVHRGCERCYAAVISEWFPSVFGTWGADGAGGRRIVCDWAEMFRDMIRLDVRSFGAERKPVMLWNDTSDTFEDWRGPMFSRTGKPVQGHDQSGLAIDRCRRIVFDCVDATPNLIHLFVTKRPQNVARMITCPECRAMGCRGSAPKLRRNCWLLYSASDQDTLEAGLCDLLECSQFFSVVGVMFQPLLGRVDMTGARCGWPGRHASIQWVVVGGECGPDAREMPLDSLRTIAEQAVGSGVPIFVKQDSGPFPGRQGRIPESLWSLKQFPSR